MIAKTPAKLLSITLWLEINQYGDPLRAIPCGTGRDRRALGRLPRLRQDLQQAQQGAVRTGSLFISGPAFGCLVAQ